MFSSSIDLFDKKAIDISQIYQHSMQDVSYWHAAIRDARYKENYVYRIQIVKRQFWLKIYVTALHNEHIRKV